ncbi:LysR family transcriptional regulator [Pseudomonas aeruginosa]|uniref:LysR family transcriptional regulator n=1 Tax=Pseudomonas TaxID=286 RepID=UPI001C0FC7E1|nr:MULTISPECIES: LysR family transcriptional regulator [Pseudomonas]ELQ8316740.1 LysR family transcriptional regulator [Pseudomonas aeruginosa]MBU5733052.1 LysR family transcriptional regulator [Pseudomonas aeruginosa]MBU5754971.1 LysR family transcriptional regulator [Pseudomonas aeruginosa]UUJ38928.1 LysR family transcriptional regulator [Pseudomonas extremaustralis]HDQ4471764.1 LysR family transcriptional regulator [Pseudomonas aeruginosa]
MDRFQEMQVFVRIAERQSFTLAADDLAIPRATVTNLIKRLERRLGARLLERTTRQVRLTHDGEAYYHRCVRLLVDLEEADNAFRNASPKGLLRANLQGTLAKHFIVPALGRFMDEYPEITLHLEEDDRLVDLVKEGVDCVLRAGALADSSLIARQVAQLEQVTVASPAYLARHGTPQSLGDLQRQDHLAVAYIARPHARSAALDFQVGQDIVEQVLPARITVTGADLYTGAALADLGIVQVPRYRIVQELEQQRLIVLLPDTPPPRMPVSVLYPHNRQLSPRVRVFTQWVAAQLAAGETAW